MEWRRAVIYLRVSRFTEDSRSLADQLHDCREFADRNRLDVAEVYEEEPGTSAYQEHVKRPVFDRMLDELESGTVVIAWALDRVTRKGAEQAGPVLRQLEEAGASLKTVTDGIDTERDESELNYSVRAALAKDESYKTSKRTRRGLASRKRAGLAHGRAPYGLLKVDGRLVQDPATYPTARRIAEAFLDGHSAYAVSKTLNAEGIPNRSGGAWQPGTLVKMVTSPGFAGLAGTHERLRGGRYADRADLYRDDSGQTVSVGEGVVTFSEWLRIRALLDERTRAAGMRLGKARRAGKRGYTTLLGGIARCGRCGGPMAGTGKAKDGGAKLYGCARRAKNSGAVDGCEGVFASRAHADFTVGEKFLTKLAALEPGEDSLLEAVADAWTAREAPEAVAELAAARDTLAEVEEALIRLDDDRADGLIDREGYARQRGRLVERRDAARAAVKAVPTPYVDVSPLLDMEIMRPAWRDSGLREKRAYLLLAVDHVVLHPATVRGRWDEDRAEIFWRDEETPDT